MTATDADQTLPNPLTPEPGPSAARRRAGTTPSRTAAALAGVVSAGLGLGVAQIVAGFSRTLRSPVIAVGDRVVDLVPAAVKDIAISLFGTNDKIALLAGIAATLVVYAAIVGVVALRKRLAIGLVGVGLFAVVGALAALNDRAGAPWWAALPTLIGAGVVGASLVAFDRAARPVPAVRGMEHPSSRRRFFATAGVITAGAGVAALVGRSLDSRFSASGSRAALDLPAPTNVLSPIPAAAQAQNAAPFITPNADFYRIDTALVVPQVPAETWSMRVTGMVDRELTITYADLLERDLIERDITLTCVSNTIGGELIGTARWLGARLDDLLAEAGIDPEATQIVGRSVDGYTCGFPVAALDGRDALIAVGMNGEPLPARARLPRTPDRARALRLRLGHQVAERDRADHLRRLRPLLGAAGLRRGGPHQTPEPDRRSAGSRSDPGRTVRHRRRGVGTDHRHRWRRALHRRGAVA